MCLDASRRVIFSRECVALRTVHILCLTIVLGVAATVFGQQEDTAVTDEFQPAIRSQPVSTGFVLVDGVYVPPPYVVEQRDGEVLINGHVVSLVQSGNAPMAKSIRPGSGGRRPHERFAGKPRRGAAVPSKRRRREYSGHVGHIELELQDNSIVLAFGGNSMTSFNSSLTANIFSTLLSDATSESKISVFGDGRAFEQVSTNQWAQIVANFRLTAELKERIDRLLEQERQINERFERTTAGAQWYGILSSPSMKYCITLTAMVLAVVALGNLLLYRPEQRGRWSEVYEGGSALGMRRIVLILACLGAFDLLLTLAAQQAGGFLELNPLGSQLITSPILLAAFKMSSLAARMRNSIATATLSWRTSSLLVAMHALHRPHLPLGNVQFALYQLVPGCERIGSAATKRLFNRKPAGLQITRVPDNLRHHAIRRWFPSPRSCGPTTPR